MSNDITNRRSSGNEDSNAMSVAFLSPIPKKSALSKREEIIPMSPLASFDDLETSNELFTRRPQIHTGKRSKESLFKEIEMNDDLFPNPPQTDTVGKWPKESRNSNDQKPYSRTGKGYIDTKLPQELRDLCLPLKCQLCSCEMGSTITAKSHYEGKKHLVNIKKWFSEHPDLVRDCPLPVLKSSTFDPEKLYCSVCDVTMSSEQQAEVHYVGKKHQDAINGKMPKNMFLNSTTGKWQRVETAKEDKTGRFGIGLAYISAKPPESNPLLENPGHKFLCDICQVPCPSQVSFNDHLAGAKHRKKMASLSTDIPPPAKDNILDTVIKSEKKVLSASDLSIYRTPSGKYYCKCCDVTVNSQAQFLQHSESRKHKHRVTLSVYKSK